MPQRILKHVRAHPFRLLVTSAAVLLLSAAVLGYALLESQNRARAGRVENCLAVNELSRKIYVTLADFEVPMHERSKFKPTTDCESIP
jgi:hypothetical protein